MAHKIWPYVVQYLHFRILKFPLKDGTQKNSVLIVLPMACRCICGEQRWQGNIPLKTTQVKPRYRGERGAQTFPSAVGRPLSSCDGRFPGSMVFGGMVPVFSYFWPQEVQDEWKMLGKTGDLK